MIYINFLQSTPFSDPACTQDGGRVILEVIRIEMQEKICSINQSPVISLHIVIPLYIHTYIFIRMYYKMNAYKIWYLCE